MSYSKVYGAQPGIPNAHIVDVEVDLSRGLHAFSIVGLPDQATEEAKDRISAAIKNSSFESPKSSNQKIVISLAPAEVKKEGAGLDLPMALAYLLAKEEIVFEPEGKIFAGELSLDGELRPTKGVLSIAKVASKKGFKEIFVPKGNTMEAALIKGLAVYGVESLQDCTDHLSGRRPIKKEAPTEVDLSRKESTADFADVKGQESAKRALEIAAAGGHNIALYGPPGTGKTMLARAFASILPPLSLDEMLEVTEIHSIAGALGEKLLTERPFRSPHHTASYVAIVGGGASPRPGEITLAHRGILFLDEFAEFETRVVESLRQPLEERFVTVSRARGTIRFPAHFILVAAMNPCPCGNYGIKGKPCICSPSQVERYKKKLSGPIIDRIDMWVEVSKIDHDKLTEKAGLSESLPALVRVIGARSKQKERFGKDAKVNGEMSARDLVTNITLEKEIKDLLNDAARGFNMSARAYHKTIKVARTIADLEGRAEIAKEHILEALSYRPKMQVY
jgi:magnesium chelatase family protein